MNITGKYSLRIMLFMVFVPFGLKAQTDTIPPVIQIVQDTSCIQINSVWQFMDPVVTDNQTPVDSVVVTQNWGPNGPVNTAIRATYTLRIEATDTNGNKATRVVNFFVDDCIPPVISLNTDDTVCHIVNTPYTPVPVTVTDNYYDKNNIALSNVNNAVVDPYTPGLYSEIFVAIDASGNRDTVVRYVWVKEKCNNVGTFFPDIEGGLSIYPNPMQHTLVVSVKGMFEYSIYDIKGAKVISEVSNQQELDLSNLKKGIYQIVIQNAEGGRSAKFAKD